MQNKFFFFAFPDANSNTPKFSISILIGLFITFRLYILLYNQINMLYLSYKRKLYLLFLFYIYVLVEFLFRRPPKKTIY